MTADSGALQQILEGTDAVAVALYRDDDAKQALVELCELLSERPCERTIDVDDAFDVARRDEVLLVTPTDEVTAVQALEGRREALRDRTAPAILFLLRGGAASRELDERAPHLASWLRGLLYDSEPIPDELALDVRRRAFRERQGQEPEAWLDAWHRGEFADDLDNNFEAQEAWLLRRP